MTASDVKRAWNALTAVGYDPTKGPFRAVGLATLAEAIRLYGVKTQTIFCSSDYSFLRSV